MVSCKKSLPNLRSERFPPMFSSRSFLFLGFYIRSVIYFKLVFICGERYILMLLTYGYPFVPVPFDEKNIISPLNCLCTFVENEISM